MADILTDMHRLEAYWSIKDGPLTVSDDSVRRVMRQELLQQHGLTEQQFEYSLKWYAHNIDDYVEVYDMVDKNLEKQIEDASKRNEAVTMTGQMQIADADNLWPAAPFYVLRKGYGTDGLSFSMQPPTSLKPGDLLRWQMGSTPRRSNARIMLGVDYEDGTTMYASQEVSALNNGDIFINLQTDTALVVERIYGVLRYEVERGEVVMLDSIAISAHPLDSTQYHKITTQFKYKRGGDIKRKPTKVSKELGEEVQPSTSIAQPTVTITTKHPAPVNLNPHN